MKPVFLILFLIMISGTPGTYNELGENKSEFSNETNSCQGPILSLKLNDNNVEKYIVTNPIEGYSESISLWNDLTFTYEQYTRAGIRFSAGNYTLKDSLLYLQSDPKSFKQMFNREKRREKWKFFILIDKNQIFVKRGNEICFQRKN